MTRTLASTAAPTSAAARTPPSGAYSCGNEKNREQSRERSSGSPQPGAYAAGQQPDGRVHLLPQQVPADEDADAAVPRVLHGRVGDFRVHSCGVAV